VSDDRDVYILQHPIEKGSETITELAFREGRAADLRGTGIGNTILMDDMMLIASRMCGQSIQVIHKLEGEDAGEAIGRARAFFLLCQGTGE
jgi:hypothetical protein